MSNYFLNFFEKIYIFQNIYLKNKFFFKKKTYAMQGEDLIAEKYFKEIDNGFYVDLGCYHPIQHNNTMLLYQKGWRGINIDINEFSIKLFNFCRPDDLNLNLAVSDKNGEVDFYYQKRLSLLNTLVKAHADRVFQKRVKKGRIKSQTITEILDDTIYKNKPIDFLKIDAEGVDLDILKSLDFSRYSPKLVCIEILPESKTAIHEAVIAAQATNKIKSIISRIAMPKQKRYLIEQKFKIAMNNVKKDISRSAIYTLLKAKNYKRIWSGIHNHIFVRNL